MTPHLSFTSVVSGLVAAGALYAVARRRRGRRGTAAQVSAAAPAPAAARPKPREIGAVEVTSVPDGLSLQEIYQRVSFT